MPGHLRFPSAAVQPARPATEFKLTTEEIAMLSLESLNLARIAADFRTASAGAAAVILYRTSKGSRNSRVSPLSLSLTVSTRVYMPTGTSASMFRLKPPVTHRRG